MTSHLVEYLNFYRKCDAPEYAVLVAGEWGTGKTFQVLNAVPKEDRFYVSLFGLQTTDEIYSAVIAEMHPNWTKVDPILNQGRKVAAPLATAVGTITGGMMGGAVAKTVAGILPEVAKAFVRKEVDNSKLLIFDDLERCAVDTKDILGVINQYVEHNGCKVVVIAHDKKIIKEIGEFKEKVFGHTVRLEPQISDAFTSFCATLPTSEGKEFIESLRSPILTVFETSGEASLRSLKYLIQDLHRLWEVLEISHRENKEAMLELVRLFSALNIEVRSEKLGARDLEHRTSGALRYQAATNLTDENPEGLTQIDKANDRYPQVNLLSNLLPDRVLIEMLIEGRYDAKNIQKSLNGSPYFTDSPTSPPWQIINNFQSYPDKTVNSAIENMQEQFAQRSVVAPGEMLHIFALLLTLADEGVIDGDIKSIACKCHRYVDEIFELETAPLFDDFWAIEGIDSNSLYGLDHSMPVHCTDLFQELVKYLKDVRKKSLIKKLPEFGKSLLAQMNTTPDKFRNRVNLTNNGDNRFAKIPVLAAIPAEDFVDTWLQVPTERWPILSSALRVRYSHNSLKGPLEPEKEWVRTVITLLNQEAENVGGVRRMRIKRSISTLNNMTDEAE